MSTGLNPNLETNEYPIVWEHQVAVKEIIADGNNLFEEVFQEGKLIGYSITENEDLIEKYRKTVFDVSSKYNFYFINKIISSSIDKAKFTNLLNNENEMKKVNTLLQDFVEFQDLRKDIIDRLSEAELFTKFMSDHFKPKQEKSNYNKMKI